MSKTPAIEFKNISKQFGSKRVLQDLSFTIRPGRIYSLIGESGCGKTTTLKVMNGLLAPDQGQVVLNDEPFDYERSVEYRRRMGYCLQGYTLFPHMNVLQNMSIIARRSGWKPVEINRRANELMNMVNLDASVYLKKMPHQLSGGQQQRVGIARALFMRPNILLMDEPFGALDPITREELQDIFIELQKRLELTVVLVTHDLSEAFKMSDEIILLREGAVAQRGRPNELLQSPADAYVDDFLRTNSPGHVMKKIRLYSVMNMNVWATQEKGGEHYHVHKLNADESLEISGHSELKEFHLKHQQEAIFIVDSSGHFLKSHYLRGAQPSGTQSVIEMHHILEGLQLLLQEEIPSIAVVNKKGILLGSFGRKAIDVLA